MITDFLSKAPRPRYCQNPGCLNEDARGDDDGEENSRFSHTHGPLGEGPVLSIGGLAGTGKTSLLPLIEEATGKTGTYGTPTGRAAIVLRQKFGKDQAKRAGTLHSLMYRPQGWISCIASGEPAKELTCQCGKGFLNDLCRCDRYRCKPCAQSRIDHRGIQGCPVKDNVEFSLRKYAGGFRDFIALDESSMITEKQVGEIRSFGLPVIMIGDYGQLPPVKSGMNPWIASPIIVLDENFRQTEVSGIVPAALEARRTGIPRWGWYGTGTYVTSAVARPDAMDAMMPDRLLPGSQSRVICWRREDRCNANLRIHSELFGSAPLAVGSRVMALTNSSRMVLKPDGRNGWRDAGWSVYVANGTCGTIESIKSMGRKIADTVVRIDAGNLHESDASPAVHALISLEQLASSRDLRPDEYSGSKWDYGYASTTYKAQGSEFDNVIVFGVGFSPYESSKQHLYTAMTRAKNKLLVIGLPDDRPLRKCPRSRRSVPRRCRVPPTISRPELECHPAGLFWWPG